MLKAPVMFFAILLTGCAATTTVRSHYIDEGSDVSGSVTGPFRWQEEGPIDLLDRLRLGVPALKERGIWVTDFRVYGKHHGWVRAEDIPALIALLGSKEPCQPVVASTVSMLQKDLSTVGHEAAYLIEGFRRGVYPVDGISLRWKLNESEQYQFDQWCERFMEQLKSSSGSSKRHA